MRMVATFFATAPEFGQWLARNHDTEAELIVGYWKKSTGKPSMTWEESVDEALCWGWIDGIRRRLDDDAYTIRFTPRRTDSIWSKRNLDRVDALREGGRMQPPGLAAWRAGHREKSGYTVEASTEELTAEERVAFGKHLDHFMAQPQGYRRQIVGWVHAAKRDDTRARRLAALIDASRQGIRVDPGQPFAHVRSS